MRTFKLFLLALILTAINGKNLRFMKGPGLDMLVKKLTSTAFSQVLNKVNAIVGMWENIATTFSTKIYEVMEDYLEGMGFDYFRSTCEFRLDVGLRLDKYKDWAKKILRIVHVPPKFADLFAEHINDAEFVDDHVYGDFDMLFNKDDPKNDKVNFAHLISMKEEKDNKITIIFTHSNADFKLSPDIIVMRKIKVIAGGGYISSEPYNILTPKAITTEDMEMIMKFFSFSMIKMMAQALGIKLKTIGPK